MTTKPRKIADSYLDLIHQFPLHPIRNESEYDEATAVAEKLYLGNESDLNDGERDYLDALDEFIADYDERRFSFSPDNRTPLQRLKWLISESETTPKALRAILGCSQSLVSMILSGQRELSKDNIKSLADHFKIEAGWLL